MSEQLLDRAQVIASFEQVSCERMTQRVRGCPFPNLCASERTLEVPLQARFIDVVATNGA